MTPHSILLSQELPDFTGIEFYCERLDYDWFGEQLNEPVCFIFALDSSDFHFTAFRKKNALIHPAAEAGEFQPELWKYDVAEFFLSSGDRLDYLEFNLAPNGAWWSCFFKGPRVPSQTEPLVGVTTRAEIGEGFWKVQASIPRSEIPWFDPETSLLNATFILDSPKQRFVTLADLGQGEPDFHRPQDFLPMRLST